MSPLVALTLIGFGLLLLLALLVWTLLAPPRRPPRPSRDATARAQRMSNDEVRGARAVRPERPKADDPFEQFLRVERDDR